MFKAPLYHSFALNSTATTEILFPMALLVLLAGVLAWQFARKVIEATRWLTRRQVVRFYFSLTIWILFWFTVVSWILAPLLITYISCHEVSASPKLLYDAAYDAVAVFAAPYGKPWLLLGPLIVNIFMWPKNRTWIAAFIAALLIRSMAAFCHSLALNSTTKPISIPTPSLLALGVLLSGVLAWQFARGRGYLSGVDLFEYWRSHNEFYLPNILLFPLVVPLWVQVLAASSTVSLPPISFDQWAGFWALSSLALALFMSRETTGRLVPCSLTFGGHTFHSPARDTTFHVRRMLPMRAQVLLQCSYCGFAISECVAKWHEEARKAKQEEDSSLRDRLETINLDLYCVLRKGFRQPYLISLWCMILGHRKPNSRTPCHCPRCGQELGHDWEMTVWHRGFGKAIKVETCRCTRCGSLRDKKHLFDGCICHLCGSPNLGRHTRGGCICKRCGRDIGHEWVLVDQSRIAHSVLSHFRCKQCGREITSGNRHYLETEDGWESPTIGPGNVLYKDELLVVDGPENSPSVCRTNNPA